MPTRFDARSVSGRRELLLRPFEESDAPALFEGVDTSRRTLHPWLPWAATQHLSAQAALDSIRLMARARENVLDPELGATMGFVVGVFDARTDELLGGTGFNRVDAAMGNAETGYWLKESVRGEGVATRACAAMLSWLFLDQSSGGFGFRRVHIFASTANTSSCAIPTRLGLRQSQHTRLDRWIDGIGYTDTLGWDVLREEWDVPGQALQHAARS
ncbi:MAG: GNAT family N-acetyltransferase [Phycisphaerales bacterium]